MQKCYGYKVDEVLYSELKFNNTDMNINITEQTTTFPCPVNKLKGQLMDNIGMKWETEHGNCTITEESIKWIMKNVVTSKYNSERCYVYNRAFARWFDNNNPYPRTGALAKDCGPSERINKCETMCRFDKIRLWAEERGLYHKGDPKTQTLKLMEEAGEICRAVLKKDEEQIIDGIGDCVVVLTNLAHLAGTSIEKCIDAAYDEIKDRTGKMSNGTFKKD
jgi:NTP pyrophosphatase (non-canonical NTP hydrolase)